MIAYRILFSPTCGRTRVSHRWCGTGIRVVLTRPKIHAAVRVLNGSGRRKVNLRGRIGCLHTNVGCKLTTFLVQNVVHPWVGAAALRNYFLCFGYGTKMILSVQMPVIIRKPSYIPSYHRNRFSIRTQLHYADEPSISFFRVK